MRVIGTGGGEEESRFFADLIRRLGSRPDSEFEQALIRVAFPLLFLLYHAIAPPETPTDSTLWNLGDVLALGFLAFSLTLVAAILIWPGQSTARRILGNIGDLGILTFWLAAGGEAAALWWWAYLWVTFGNGFRYGLHFLHISAALSLAGFGIVTLVNPFWGQHQLF